METGVDTSPDFARRHRESLMSLSGAQRLKMGMGMFSSARAFAIAGIKHSNPGASEIQIKRELFLRFYKTDFTEAQVKKIFRGLQLE